MHSMHVSHWPSENYIVWCKWSRTYNRKCSIFCVDRRDTNTSAQDLEAAESKASDVSQVTVPDPYENDEPPEPPKKGKKKKWSAGSQKKQFWVVASMTLEQHLWQADNSAVRAWCEWVQAWGTSGFKHGMRQRGDSQQPQMTRGRVLQVAPKLSEIWRQWNCHVASDCALAGACLATMQTTRSVTYNQSYNYDKALETEVIQIIEQSSNEPIKNNVANIYGEYANCQSSGAVFRAASNHVNIINMCLLHKIKHDTATKSKQTQRSVLCLHCNWTDWCLSNKLSAHSSNAVEVVSAELHLCHSFLHHGRIQPALLWFCLGFRFWKLT